MTAAAANSTTSCPHCAALLATDAVDDGTTILCAACGQPFVLRPAADSRKTSRKAVASLVLGILSIVFWCLAGIPAILLGVLALIEIRRDEGRLKGRKFAVAGIIISCVLGVVCIPVVPAVILPAIQKFRAVPAFNRDPKANPERVGLSPTLSGLAGGERVSPASGARSPRG